MARSLRQMILLVAVAAVGVSLSTAAASPAVRADPAMSQALSASSPNPGSRYNILSGVSADSATDAWAVGFYQNSTTHLLNTLILHWNGTAWSRVKSPNPGPNGNALEAVSAISPTDAWAVGDQQASATSSNPGKTLILHWNGTAWSQVPSPSPSPRENALNGVSAISATAAWAAGYYYNPAKRESLSLLLHWNGTTWSKVTSPSPAGPGGLDQLQGVSATSGTSAWAAGSSEPASTGQPSALTLRWNGSAWSQVTSLPGSKSTLYGISAVSATNAWAAGDYASTSVPAATLTLHWNGTSWTQAASPNPGRAYDILTGVSADSATDAWAVGYYSQPNGFNPQLTLTLHWNGTAWSAVKSPDPSGRVMGLNNLDAVSAVSPTDAWAVGCYASPTTGAQDTLILHWNGTSWSKM